MVVRANKHADGIGGHLSTFASLGRALRRRLQPLLPRQGRRPRRRPRLLPGPRRARHLRPGLPRGPARRGASSTTSAARSAAAACRATRTRGSCPTSGSSRRCRWASARSTRSTRPASTATSHNRAHRRHQRQSGCGASSATARCDEPETLGSLSLAGREQLDNLILVVNCNLQRLDGPVRGNGKIIQELEAIFRGAGWNVIKVIWGASWDELLARDVDGVLLNKMNTTVDGEFQRYAVESRRLHPRALLRPRPPPAQDGRAPLRRRAARRCPAAGTTTASSTPPTRPPPSTGARPRSSSPRR